MAKAGTDHPSPKTRGRKTAEKSTARGPKGRKTKMPIMGAVTWTDPRKATTYFVYEADYEPGREAAHICLTIPLRDVASLELRPVRRPLTDEDGRLDTAGHIEDALRLANTPV